MLGSIASDLHEFLLAHESSELDRNRDHGTKRSEKNIDSTAPHLFSTSRSSEVGESMMSRLINSDIPSRLWLETIKTYQQDYYWIKRGILKYPWDGVLQYNNRRQEIEIQVRHRQYNPAFALSQSLNTIAEAVAIFSRRNKGLRQGVTWQDPVSNLYPDYYMNDFHYQTDGWLSTVSAQRYEASTETLFLGRQDAMQRQTLLPLLKQKAKIQTILEVACGTGRFATFLRDNFPEVNLTLSDLSPYYLEKARENDAYWLKFTEMDTTGIKPATFVQANAEHLPFPDSTFDAVLAIYLFHELPEPAQKRAAAEMVRVCKPGGIIVLTDSIQQGDRLRFKNIANFAKLNEPHYENYVTKTYLPELFIGTDCGEKYIISSTKTVSFVKKLTR